MPEVAESAIREYWEKSTPFRDWSYEEKRRRRYDLQDYMHSVIPFTGYAGKKVLEVGCGAGTDSIEFARNGAIVTAMDITNDALSRTMQAAVEANVKLKVERGSATDIPLPDNEYDLVYSYGVLHHVPSVASALSEISRVLKPRGRVVAMLYNRDSLLFSHSILKKAWDEKPSLFRDHITSARIEVDAASWYSERNEGCPFTVCYTKDEAEDLFGSVFRVESVTTHYPVIDLPGQRKVKIQCPEELGWHLIVKAEKTTR